MMSASLVGRAGPLVGIGHAGVIAFFVHTSLVLMFSLERLGPGTVGLARRFYVRRIFRIYPLAIATVAVVLLFQVPATPVFGAQFAMPSLTIVTANVLLIQNVVGGSSVLGPLWSLPYEVEMYAILPLAFLLARPARGAIRLPLLCVLAGVVGFVVQRATGHANILAYAPCFLAGVTAYAQRSFVKPLIASTFWPPMLVAWFIVFLRCSPADPAAQIAFQAGMSLFLGVSVNLFRDSTSPVWNGITQWIAKYSYGIYLVHFPALWVVRPIWEANVLLGTVVWLALTGAISVAAYHLLESPMIEWGKRLTSRGAVAPAQPLLNGSSIATSRAAGRIRRTT